jgi:hypothetical protein
MRCERAAYHVLGVPRVHDKASPINCWLCTRCMLRLFPLKKYHDETAATSSSNRIISARLISSIGLALSLGRRGAQGRSLKPCCDVVRRRRGANNSSQIAPQRVFGSGLLPAAIVTRIVAWSVALAQCVRLLAGGEHAPNEAARRAWRAARRLDPIIHHQASNAAGRYSDTEFARRPGAPKNPAKLVIGVPTFFITSPLPPSAEAFRQFAQG